MASELARLAAELGRPAIFLGRDRLDLLGEDGVEAAIDRIGPEAVINASAYTAVDLAEREVDEAYRLNRDAPERMAVACASRSLPFVHFSTDYVFDGRANRPYRPDDPTAPLNVYGRSKAEGEARVLAAGGRAVILRTAWVFGAFGRNFMKTMLSLAESRDEISVVDDQRGRPTWSRDVALAALAAVRLVEDGGAPGLYHAAGADDASWADLAEALFTLSRDAGGPSARVRRITTADYPTAAARSAYSSLDSSKLAAASSWRPSPWRQSAAAALTDYRTNGRKEDA